MSFGNQEIKTGGRAHGLDFSRVEEHTTHTHVDNPRDVVTSVAAPVDIYAFGCLYTTGDSPGRLRSEAPSIRHTSLALQRKNRVPTAQAKDDTPELYKIQHGNLQNGNLPKMVTAIGHGNKIGVSHENGQSMRA